MPKPLRSPAMASPNCAVSCQAQERSKLSELPTKGIETGTRADCPERLSVDGDGLVMLELKRAFTDG